MFARFARVRLGDVGNYRLRQNAEDCHRHAGHHGYDIAPRHALAAEHGNQKDRCVSEEARDNQFLFAELRRELVDGRIQAQTDRRHDNGENKRIALVRVHQPRDIERKSRLEQRYGEEINDVRVYEATKLTVLE